MVKLLGSLYIVLPKFLAGKVMMCTKSAATYYLRFKKYDSLPSTLGHDRIRILDMVDQHEYPWMDRIRTSQKTVDVVSLESKDELLSFLKICMDSTFVHLKVRREPPSSGESANYDCYAVMVLMPEFDLQEIDIPLVPELELRTSPDPAYS
jgi:hypothetical protein